MKQQRPLQDNEMLQWDKNGAVNFNDKYNHYNLASFWQTKFWTKQGPSRQAIKYIPFCTI